MNKKRTKKSFGINLRPGTKIIGHWKNNRYTIVRKLGSGMIGSVYLCDNNGRDVALKISHQRLSMTKEVNVLKSIAKAQDKFLGPSLFDVDDWIRNDCESYSFYVMDYIKGEQITMFLRKRGREWVGVMLLQLLEQLQELHESGWVFGDLKADNIIVETDIYRARFIDVGGTTKTGRSVKEYTEFCDRGYWGLGSRQAEPSYDLFALVMVFLTVYYPTYFKRERHSLTLLENKLNQIDELRPFQSQFKKALRGDYDYATQMKRDVMNTLMGYKDGKKKPDGSLIEAFLILSMATILYVVTLLII